MNNLRTFIRSKADGLDCNVLSPNKTIPWPGKDTTGFTPAAYNTSRYVLEGFHANLTAFLIAPRLKPAGENHGSLTVSVYTHKPAMSPFNGIQRYVLLYLSYWYFQPESATTYEEERAKDVNHVWMFVVSEPAWLTTSAYLGEIKAIQSVLGVTTLSIMNCCVTTGASPVNTNETLTSSLFSNRP